MTSKRKRAESLEPTPRPEADEIVSRDKHIQFLENKVADLERELAQVRKECTCKQNTESSDRIPSWTEQWNEKLIGKADAIKAFQAMSAYFHDIKTSQAQGSIVINDQRYILVSTTAMTVDFVGAFQDLYADTDPKISSEYARGMLFDLARIAGESDSRRFLQDPTLNTLVAKLVSGPIHFACTGWAQVELLEFDLTPENFYLVFVHHHSFEADSWLKARGKQTSCVCAMNAGYSSGWVSQCLGFDLTTMEIQCRGKGHPRCLFIASPLATIDKHFRSYIEAHPNEILDPDLRYPSPFEFKAREDFLKAAKKKAEEASQLKSTFLANVSHEIRTPLNGILGVVSVMLENERDARNQAGDTESTPNEEFLHLIKRSGQFLLRIVNDILDFSKIEANLLEIEKVPYPLSDLDLHIQNFLRAHLLGSGKQIEVKGDFSSSKEPLLFTDPVRLQQIFNNLLGNAIKFTQSHGSVEYGAFQRASRVENGTELVFFVRDTGTGIPVDKHTIIFERFQQVAPSAEHVHTGTGLGLAITKRLVELLGGTIWLESVPYVGSTFYFSHPCEVPAATTSSAPVYSERLAPSSSCYAFPNEGRSLSVLLVEDNNINREVVDAILKKAGCRVVTATDGQQAVELFKEHTFDAIFMDIQMPVMDGITATKIIRDIEKKSGQHRTTIIALTANAMRGDGDMYLEMGFDSFISKPFSKENLTETLLKIQQNRRLGNE